MASSTETVALTVTLPADVAAALRAAASGRGWTPESLAADCIAQQLEISIRHRVVLERIEQIDAALLEMAQAVGELSASGEGFDLSTLCQYQREARSK